VKQRC